MANLSKAFSVLSRACDRLARMGVTDVHQRITARILPPEKCGAEDRALELAQEAIGELHARGLEAEARALSVQLEVEPLAPARLAGSTVVDDGFLSPPPIARAIGAAVLRTADALFPPAAAPGSELPSTAKPGDELPVAVPPPEVPVPPVRHEVPFGEGLGAGVKVGLDLASGPDATVVAPAPRVPSQLGYTEAELAEIDRELAAEAEVAAKERAHHQAIDGAEAEAERAAAQAELPSGQALPEDLPPVVDELHQPNGPALVEALRKDGRPGSVVSAPAGEDLERGDPVALVDGVIVKTPPTAPSTPADRDQAEHIEDVVGGVPETPSAPSAP